VIYSAKNIFWRCCGTVVTVSQSFVNRHRLTGRIFFLPWRPANLARCLAMPQGRAMSCEELVSTLRDLQTYEVELDWKTYQVEVELLENTGKYLHVMVAVDDGSLPASLSPLTHSFVRKKLSARG